MFLLKSPAPPEQKRLHNFFTNGIKVTTDISSEFQLLTSKGKKIIKLPYPMDQGESITLATSIGWPLDDETSKLIEKEFINNSKEFTLGELKYFLLKHGKLLNRAKFELIKFPEGTIDGLFPINVESPKLIYKINVTTSFSTIHSAILEIKVLDIMTTISDTITK